MNQTIRDIWQSLKDIRTADGIGSSKFKTVFENAVQRAENGEFDLTITQAINELDQIRQEYGLRSEFERKFNELDPVIRGITGKPPVGGPPPPKP